KRWLNILGCRFEKYKKGIYFDGHKREDVVEYWKRFLKEMRTLERRMVRYEGSIMEPILLVLGVGEQELILVTHDECSFCSNDGKRGIWVHDEKMPLRKKGNGKSIMRRRKKKNPNISAEACCYFTPGKNQENYWMVEHLLKQIKEKAIHIFEAKFPNATAIFAFDNSMNHLVFADDALVMQRMNKGPEGKQSIMRLTIFINNNGQLIEQEMVFENNYSDPNLRRKPKGIKRVLEERSLWKKGLNLECLMCKKKENSEQIDCCLRRIMASQPDFLAQKSAIVELIEVDIVTIRRFARKSWRYMELYHKRLTGKLAERACKKFKSHRRISQKELTLFLQEN
ncbi:5034_t:CDS:2, partial [Cetraspora pellucida]